MLESLFYCNYWWLKSDSCVQWFLEVIKGAKIWYFEARICLEMAISDILSLSDTLFCQVLLLKIYRFKLIISPDKTWKFKNQTYRTDWSHCDTCS